MGAFHAYDIRGVYNVDFDKDIAYKVGFFLPELLSADKVLVGRDARVSSDEIHEYLLKGLTDAGADVYACGRTCRRRTKCTTKDCTENEAERATNYRHS